ncbi:hypothetical protein SAMN04489761_2674 [Tenacibaculum sp. MAR_2009_124]|uniref:hypothetical protein n=1 Tax=Tenacibaculum sp. MAR_2009_124 TaxID=1250059 RepID=UPI000896453A|nr:hypothetical protein [Tenacibaculum sp. MAR_2009_124]SEC32236.1 hypothetical protein SAMN04489761_2674 [Tenacibaculum sp. MAR_2009_124]
MKTRIKIAVLAVLGINSLVSAQEKITTENGSKSDFIYKNGEIGIGTNSPTEKLTIASSIVGYKSLLSFKELSNNGDNAMGLDWYFAGASGFPWGATARIEAARQNQSASFDLKFHTALNGVLSEKVGILANGNVGIGVPNPSSKLEVKGDFRIGNGGVYNDLIFKTGTPFSGTNGVFEIIPKTMPGSGIAKQTTYFKNASHSNGKTEHGVIIDGNLGIGTISPNAKLDILSRTDKVALRLSMPTSEDAASYEIKWANQNNNIVHRVQYANTYYDVMTMNRTNRNVIFTGGDIGIGTTSPNAKLDILSKTDKVALRLSMPTSEDAASYEIKWANENINVVHRVQYSGVYYDVMNVNRANRNVVFNGGQVGIGTNTMGNHKLAVEGSIGAREIKVEAFPNWSDFVFYEDYQLPSLTEVENHIKEKGHLKDIPSAKEVEKNGFYLGEMDAKLLQKIEELTLYTIEQEKKINNQNKEIKSLKSQEERIDKLEKENKILKTLLEKVNQLEKLINKN